MVLWISAVLRRLRRHAAAAHGATQDTPAPRMTPEARAAEERAWEEARQRVAQREAQAEAARRGTERPPITPSS